MSPTRTPSGARFSPVLGGQSKVGLTRRWHAAVRRSEGETSTTHVRDVAAGCEFCATHQCQHLCRKSSPNCYTAEKSIMPNAANRDVEGGANSVKRSWARSLKCFQGRPLSDGQGWYSKRSNGCLGQCDKGSINEPLTPVELLRNDIRAQDGEPERREDRMVALEK